MLELAYRINTKISNITGMINPLPTSIPMASTNRFSSQIMGCLIEDDTITDAAPYIPEILLPYVSVLTNVPWKHFQYNINRKIKKAYYDLFRDEYRPEIHDTLLDLLSEVPIMLHLNSAVLFALISVSNKIKTDMLFGLPVLVYTGLTK